MSKKWKLQPQEQDGDYMFSGQPVATANIVRSLTRVEIMQITLDVYDRVKEKNGADYLQVFKDDQGNKIYCIDDRDHWTILFAHEY